MHFQNQNFGFNANPGKGSFKGQGGPQGPSSQYQENYRGPRGYNRGYQNSSRPTTNSWDYGQHEPALNLNDSGQWERRVDVFKISLTAPKGEVLRQGRAGALVLPTEAMQRLRSILHRLPLMADDTQWNAWTSQIPNEWPGTAGNENDIWRAHNYDVRPTQQDANLHFQTKLDAMSSNMLELQKMLKDTMSLVTESRQQGPTVTSKKRKATAAGEGDEVNHLLNNLQNGNEDGDF